MNKLLLQQTGYPHSLLIDNSFTAWKIAFLVNNIHEDTPVLASAFAPYTFATQHQNIKYVDISLDGNIDQRMLNKVKDFSILALHHFPTIAFKHGHTDMCIIEDLTHMLGSPIKRTYKAVTAIIDFQSLLNIKAAALLFDDIEKYNLAKHLISNGVEKKKFWNFDLTDITFNADLDQNLISRIESSFKAFLSSYTTRKDKARFLNTMSSQYKLLQSTPFDECNSFVFYPLFLVPELYCPKEDIYASLIKHGLDVHVHYKPIYKLSSLKQDISLHVTEDLYKAELSISLLTAHSKEEITQIIKRVLDEYRFGGCSF